MTLEAKAIAALLAILALIGCWWRMESYYDHRGYQRAKTEDQAAADAQAANNRDLQRASELRYTVQAQARDRFIVQTVTEIRHETDSLAACRLTAAAVQRMRELAACAREDGPASCGTGQQVPDAH